MLTYVDKMKIPDGSILLDNTLDCAVTTVVSADNPKVFVIPNDPDYKRILADPLTFHTRYILVPKPESGQFGLVVNETYPALYWNGAGFAVRVKSFGETPLCPPYRLYRVVGHPSSAGGSTT